MANRNALELLESMMECGEVTTREVWETANMILPRYHPQGLLSRSGGREKTYMLTMKGEERLIIFAGELNLFHFLNQRCSLELQ